VTVGALIALLYWGSFFVAMMVPGTSYEDVQHPVERPLGLWPANLIAAGAVVTLAIVGLVLARRSPPAQQSP